MRISKIVSGGQTGADTGALDAAIWCDIPHGGWCPKGRLCEEGEIPAQYLLMEMTTKDYLKRTEANVVDSDATMIFTHGPPTGGSRRTAEFAKKHKRPFFLVDLSRQDRGCAPAFAQIFFTPEYFSGKLPQHCTMNVAGSRESGKPGIAREVMLWMIPLIDIVNHTLHYPPGNTGDPARHVIRDKWTGA